MGKHARNNLRACVFRNEIDSLKWNMAQAHFELRELRRELNAGFFVLGKSYGTLERSVEALKKDVERLENSVNRMKRTAYIGFAIVIVSQILIEIFL